MSRGFVRLLTLAVYQTSVLAIVQIGAFGVCWVARFWFAALRISGTATALNVRTGHIRKYHG